MLNECVTNLSRQMNQLRKRNKRHVGTVCLINHVSVMICYTRNVNNLLTNSAPEPVYSYNPAKFPSVELSQYDPSAKGNGVLE